MPGCLSLFGQRGMAAFSMKDDLTGRFLRACIERNRGTKKAAAAAGKTYNTANIGNIKVISVGDGAPTVSFQWMDYLWLWRPVEALRGE